MNRANVWTLSDLSDSAGLAKAIKNVPTCVNVSGWSYAGGKRRGVCKSADGKWNISPSEGVAATILHYATISNSLPCTILALEHGASADTKVLGATADSIAQDLGYSELAEVIQVARRKEQNRVGVCEEDEIKTRKLLELREVEERERMDSQLHDGVVDVEVTLRDAGVTSKYHLTVPRYIKFKTFQKKVETLVGQRVLLSFIVSRPPNDAQSSSLVTTDSPSKTNVSLPSVSDMEERAKWEEENDEKRKPRYLELKQQTVAVFLGYAKPQCIARPLTFCYASAFGEISSTSSLSQSSKEHHESGLIKKETPLTNLAKKINAVEGNPDERIEKMKRILLEEEKPEVYGKKINGEQRDQCIQRLYARPLTKIQSKKQDYEEYCTSAIAKFQSPSRSRNLSPSCEEFVQRLFDAAVQREAKVAEIEQNIWERLPKPNARQLPPDEIEAASQRLFKSGGKQGLIEAEKRVYGDPKKKVVPDMGAHLESIYHGAVEKKRNAMKKLEGTYGDFRSKKCEKKLTKEQIKEMGDRLCTKH